MRHAKVAGNLTDGLSAGARFRQMPEDRPLSRMETAWTSDRQGFADQHFQRMRNLFRYAQNGLLSSSQPAEIADLLACLTKGKASHLSARTRPEGDISSPYAEHTTDRFPRGIRTVGRRTSKLRSFNRHRPLGCGELISARLISRPPSGNTPTGQTHPTFASLDRCKWKLRRILPRTGWGWLSKLRVSAFGGWIPRQPRSSGPPTCFDSSSSRPALRRAQRRR